METTSAARVRIIALWALFALGALGAALAVQRLYSRAQREVAEQADRALQAAVRGGQARAREESEALRLGVIRSLAGLHVDGLASVLRRWDESNAHVVDVFLWEPTRGFLLSPPPADAAGALRTPSLELLRGFWEEFGIWRSGHAAEAVRAPHVLRGWRITMTPTVKDATLAAGGLGYQNENLELLTHAGRAVDPWAGVAVKETEPNTPWVFWYQPGPDAPVRGCLVELGARLGRLRAEWKDTSVVALRIQPAGARSITAADALELSVSAPLQGFPGYELVASVGDVFQQKQSDVWWSAAAVALLLALFLLGGSALAWHTRRVAREAERQLTFVAQVSHELRTPLTSIRMFADLLGASEIVPEKRAKFAGTISRESARLGALIDRLLTFNALERGTRSVKCSAFDATALARETADELQAALQAAGLTLRLELPAMPLLAHGEPSAVKQALVNLLENASKYAGSGHGGREVVVSGATEARGVTLRVADDGPGVPDAIRSRVFEPFVQGSRSMTDKTPGIGLGLSIARGLLRQGGGELVLLSSARGASFELRLPRAETPGILPATPSADPKPGT